MAGLEGLPPLNWAGWLGVLVGLLIGLPVGAWILQAASALGGVEDLRFVKAVGLVVLLTAISLGISLGWFFLLASWGFGKGEAGQELFFGSCLFLFGLQLLVSGGLLGLFLSVKYLRGLLIAVMQYCISLILLADLAGVALVVVAIFQISLPAKP
ncbi:MAG: hypothetical protein JO112_05190 [Planctomycetes bacterium]|nr:hypothetical protein [Planctomycetota bacterium]